MSPDSFTGIYQEFHPRIRRYLTRLVGVADAEDLAQEVFLKAHRGLETFEGRSSVSTWIYRIAGNAAIDFRRKASSRRLKNESLSGPGVVDQLPAPKMPAKVPDDEEMLSCVREFVDSLPENYRAAFVLHDLEGMPNASIARILDISLPTAKIRIHRAKMRLKHKMENGCCLYYDEDNRLACSRRA